MTPNITGITTVCSTVGSELRVIGLCNGKPPVTGGFPPQRASNADNVTIGLRHHGPKLNWTLSHHQPVYEDAASPVWLGILIIKSRQAHSRPVLL